jgi:hypothetical protein
LKESAHGRHRLPDHACDRRIAARFDLGDSFVSADVIPFVPRSRSREPDEATSPSHSRALIGDLVMDHADTAPCEYLPTREPCDDEPA